MRSVADELKAEQRRAVATLDDAARVRLALELGARDLETFRLAHDPPLDAAPAYRLLCRHRQQGRRPSSCLEEPTA